MTSTLDLLEARLEKIERCVLGAKFDGSSTTTADLTGETQPTSDIVGRVTKLQSEMPSTTNFDTAYQHYKLLGLTNEHDLRRLMAAPASLELKIDLIIANANNLRQMSLKAETILRLKEYIGGEAWYRARDELPRLGQAEVVAAELLIASSGLARRVDTSLVHYDRAVEIVSEKMLLTHQNQNE
jgi:hypothetical protein